jgi:hypothetical protein
MISILKAAGAGVPYMRRDDLFAEVRTVLLAEWDPCGVGDNANLSDEYDKYASEIANALLSSPALPSLIAVLEVAESELGVALPQEQRLRTAQRLLSLS